MLRPTEHRKFSYVTLFPYRYDIVTLRPRHRMNETISKKLMQLILTQTGISRQLAWWQIWTNSGTFRSKMQIPRRYFDSTILLEINKQNSPNLDIAIGTQFYSQQRLIVWYRSSTIFASPMRMKLYYTKSPLFRGYSYIRIRGAKRPAESSPCRL